MANIWNQSPFASSPFSEQDAVDAVGPLGPIPAQPIQPMQPMGPPMQPPPEAQQSPLGRVLSSPGMAMASQAANNLSALNRGMVPNRTPVDAMRQAANQSQMIQMRRAAIVDQQLARAEAVRQRDVANQLRMASLMKPDKPGALEQRLAALRMTLPDEVQNDPDWMRHPLAADDVSKIISGGGQNINVDIDNRPPALGDLAGADSAKSKEDFRMNLEAIPELLTLSQFDPNFLTGVGQLGMGFNKVRDRWGSLPDDEKSKYQDYVQFENRVARMFNSYRKMITGAAASPAEMEDLRQSIANMGQGPAGFQASLEGMMEDSARDLRGAIYLAATSDVEMGTEEMGKRLDRIPAQEFKSDKYKDSIGDYVAESLGYNTEDIGGWTPEQRTEFSRYMKSLGF